jgi:phenylacetate-CoA ligase
VGNTELQLQAAADLRADGYVGTPSFLRILLEKAAETGVALPHLQKALVSGEAFPAALRDWLGDRGVAAYQCYATADVGLIAYETEARQGLVIDEGVIVEIVRPGTPDPVPEGEVGEVVVTVLQSAYPLLRFGTGDLSAVLPGACPAGRISASRAGWAAPTRPPRSGACLFIPARLPKSCAAIPRVFEPGWWSRAKWPTTA